MYHFRKCLSAHSARKAMDRYFHEKMLSLGKSKPTACDKIEYRYRRCTNVLHYYISRIFLYHYINVLWQKIRAEGTLTNFLVTSFTGFLGGVLLTYLLYAFLVLQLYFGEVAAGQVCFVLGPVLTLGLAFSQEVRCMVFLILPEFFSRRGRQALLAYAFILALTGPGRNTLHNTEVLSSSLACGQEQLKSMARQVVEAIRKPFAAVRDALRAVMRRVREIALRIRDVLLAVKRIVVAIARAVGAAVRWLRSVLSACHNKMGTPYERCSRALDASVADCRARLPGKLARLCSLALVTKLVCYPLRLMDMLCVATKSHSESVVGVIGRKVRGFVRMVRDAFYVSLETRHAFSMSTSASRSLTEVSVGIATEVRQRAAAVVGAFDWMSTCSALAFTFIIIKAVFFRHRFLSSDQYENLYLTDDLVELDLRRAALGRETLLPLNRREQRYYVPLKSCILAYNERRRLVKTIAILFNISLKLCIHMFTDYCLFWMLMLIRRHGGYTTIVSAPGMPTVQIQGKGILADMLRSIVKAFQSLGIHLKVDTVPCLPQPSPPNLTVYVQIASLVGVVWALALLEPFGLRLRHVVLRRYHPRRARERAVWLYNSILRQRGSFVKTARRLLRRLLAPGTRPTGASVKALLLARWPCLWVVLGREAAACSLCGESASDRFPLVLCPTDGCGARYCEQCYGDIGNVCPGCHSPLEYGDLSDVSLERDSSDEEPRKTKQSDATSSSGFFTSEDEDEEGEEGDDGGDDGGGGGGGRGGGDGRGGRGGGAGADRGGEEGEEDGYEGLSDGEEQQPLLRRRKANPAPPAKSSSPATPHGGGAGGGGASRPPRSRRRRSRRRRRPSSSGSSRHSYQYRDAEAEAGAGAGPLTAAQRAALGLPPHFRDVEAQSILDLACMQQFFLPRDFRIADFTAQREQLLRAEYKPGWALRNRRLRMRPLAGDAGVVSGHSTAGGSGDFVENDYLFAPATPDGASKSKCAFQEAMESGDTLSNVSSLPFKLINQSSLQRREPSARAKSPMEQRDRIVEMGSDNCSAVVNEEFSKRRHKRHALMGFGRPHSFLHTSRLQSRPVPAPEISVLFTKYAIHKPEGRVQIGAFPEERRNLAPRYKQNDTSSLQKVSIVHEMENVNPFRKTRHKLSSNEETKTSLIDRNKSPSFHLPLPSSFPSSSFSNERTIPPQDTSLNTMLSSSGVLPDSHHSVMNCFRVDVHAQNTPFHARSVEKGEPALIPNLGPHTPPVRAPSCSSPSSSSPSPPPTRTLDWFQQPDIVRDISVREYHLERGGARRVGGGMPRDDRAWVSGAPSGRGAVASPASSPTSPTASSTAPAFDSCNSSSKDSSSPDADSARRGRRKKRFCPYRKRQRDA